MQKTGIKRDRCLDWLRNTASEGILKHSLIVNRVAVIIGSELAARFPAGTIDINLIDCASLLHDIAKPPVEGHENAGATAIAKLGANYKEVAEIVRQHGLSGNPVTWEQIVVNYADKLVKHDQVVTIKERLVDLESRRPQNAAEFLVAWPRIEKMQERILTVLDITEDELIRLLVENTNGSRQGKYSFTHDGVR